MRSLIFFFVFLSASFVNSLFAQKEATVWYFGCNGGLDFISGSPVLRTDGLISTNEGTAVMSDRTTGGLLFYTDGVTVWDRNHNVMPNGSGLLGGPSSTQAALILPDPGNTQKYYIFTADAGLYANPPSQGIRYNVVDMSLNGGFGNITAVKNQLLYQPASEKLTAVKHCNGKDFWIITHQFNNTNNFSVYLLTATGVNATPVVSSVGSVHVADAAGQNTLGYMKSSPDGNRLAVIVNPSSFTASQVNLDIFDFNRSTGIISNPLIISRPRSDYGLSFSPDNSKLYVSSYVGSVNQFNLASGVASTIAASKFLLSSGGQFYGMQLAYDGKLYIARNIYGLQCDRYLAVVNSPNLLGAAAGFVAQGFDLTSNHVWYGLPNFMDNYFAEPPVPIDVSSNTAICIGDNITLTASGTTSAGYSWAPSSGLNSTIGSSVSANPIVTTTYSVNEIDASGCATNNSENIIVEVKDTCKIICGELFIPNVFSPNGDDNNDIFFVQGNCFKTFSLKIFNRWGEKVFSAEGGPASGGEIPGWNGIFRGELLNTGVFAFELSGTFSSGKELLRKGNISLIR